MGANRNCKATPWLTDDGLLRVGGWARDGLTDEEIALKIGIARTTIYDWKLKYPTFAAALADTKDVADRKVETSLYKRATGYDYDEIKTVSIFENGRATGATQITKTRKHVPADVTAIIYWTSNRKPAAWRRAPGGAAGDDALGIEDLEPLAKLLARGGEDE